MKKQIATLLTGVFIVASIFTGCGGEGKESVRKLSAEDRAFNSFLNISMIYSGSMMVMFSGMAENIGEIFSEEGSESEKLEKAMGSLDEELVSMVNEGLQEMAQQMDSIKTNNPAVFNRIFDRESMRDMVALNDQFTIPKDFKKLDRNLSSEDILRYVLYLNLSGAEEGEEAEKTEVANYLGEMMNKMQEVSADLEGDEELNRMMTE